MQRHEDTQIGGKLSDTQSQISTSGESNSTPAQTAPARKSSKITLIIGSLAIVAAYFSAITLSAVKVSFKTVNGASEISDAILNYKANDAASTTVYNQMVTNGWAAKDLLHVIGNQNSRIIDNQVATVHLMQATNTLIFYGLGVIAVIGIAILFGLNSRKS